MLVYFWFGCLILLIMDIACIPQRQAQFIIEKAWSATDLQTPKDNTDPLPTLAETPVLDSQGNLIVLGKFVERMDFDGDGVHELEFDKSSSFNYYLASIKAGGQLNWVHQFGSESVEIYSIMDMGYAVTTDPDDNVYLTGLTAGTTDFDSDGLSDIVDQDTLFQFLARYTPGGQLSWVMPLEGALLSHSRLIYDTKNNGLFLAGNPKYDCLDPEDLTTCDTSENRELTVRYYDTQGLLMWETISPEISQGTAGNIELRDVAVSQHGELYVSAIFNGVVDLDVTDDLPSLVAPFNADSSRSQGAFWAKYDERGNPTVAYSLCSVICFRGRLPLSLDSEGSLYVGGEFSLRAADSTTYGHLAKFDRDNKLVWFKKRDPDWFLKSFFSHSSLDVDERDNLYSTGVLFGEIDADGDGVVDMVADVMLERTGGVYAVQYDHEGVLQWVHRPVQEQVSYSTVNASWISSFQNNKLYYGGYFSWGRLDPDGEGPLLPLPLNNGSYSFELFFFYFSSPIAEAIRQEVEHSHYHISEAYPSPSPNQSAFTVSLSNQEDIQINLYDILGRNVRSIFTGTLQPNIVHQFVIDGNGLPSGTYIYRVTGANFAVSKYHILIK